MREAAELPDELVDQIPEPLDWQIFGNRPIAVQDVIEDCTVIFVRREAVVDIGLQSRVDVSASDEAFSMSNQLIPALAAPVVEFLVEYAEDLAAVGQMSHNFGFWPFSLRKVFLCQSIPARGVQAVDLGNVAR